MGKGKEALGTYKVVELRTSGEVSNWMSFANVDLKCFD